MTMTFDLDKDHDVIDAFLGTPKGSRAALLKEALRFYIASGEIEHRQEDSENTMKYL